jgi:hypothetical protein
MSTKDHVAVRLDNETLLRIDAIRALLDTEWRDATRSDVLRLLILKGLEHFEKKHRTELEKRRGAAPASEASTQALKRGAARRGGAARAGAGTSKSGSAATKRGVKKKSPPASS